TLFLRAVIALLALSPLSARAQPSRGSGSDDDILPPAGGGTKPAHPPEVFRLRSPNDKELPNLDRPIPPPGSEQFSEREQASWKLIALGPPALPALRRAQADKDPEVAQRAKSCAQAIERGGHLPAVIRLLVRQKPEGAAEALLHYLPFAAD